MLTRADKKQAIANISEKITKSGATFLVDFKGMDVEQVTTLRKQLSNLDSEMRVVRNTLAKRALMDHPEIEADLSKDFVGTNALVFSYGDVGASAKALKDYSKEVEFLVLKKGVMDGKVLSKESVEALADLPPKEVLQAMLLGTLQAPMSKFVRTLSAVPSGFVRVLAANKDKAS